MYLVVAHATAQPERHTEMSQLLVEMATTSRNEKGCLSYIFANDVENPASFWSIEQWTDQAALEAHLAAPQLAKMMEKLGPLLDGAPTITGYEVPGEPDHLG